MLMFDESELEFIKELLVNSESQDEMTLSLIEKIEELMNADSDSLYGLDDEDFDGEDFDNDMY